MQELRERILFVISRDGYVRNYLRTGIIESLSENFDVDIICDESLALLEEVSASRFFVGTYKIPSKTEKRRMLFLETLMWRFRKRSVTFFYRWQRRANWPDIDFSTGKLAAFWRYLRFLLSLLLKRDALLPVLLGNRLAFPLVAAIHTLRERLSPRLMDRISDSSYSLVVVPSAAYEPVLNEIFNRTRDNHVPSLCLIDNWDNLSSKTIFWEKPNFLGVWGPQARDQAINIHRFNSCAIHMVGTPRFDSYFELRGRKGIPRIYDFPYILFVGSALPFDEIEALKLLEKAILNQPEVPPNTKIVYRPHPWQQNRRVPATFRESDFERTILDKQMDQAYQEDGTRNDVSQGFQPSLDYYPSVLMHAEIIVGPLTTMLFEGAICLKPIVALSYSDGSHFTTSMRYLTHFDGLEEAPGFFFCHTKKDLAATIELAFANKIPDQFLTDQVTAKYLFWDNHSYGERLKSLVSEIVQSSHQSPKRSM